LPEVIILLESGLEKVFLTRNHGVNMKKKTKWYFIFNSSLITVRAETRAEAYSLAREQLGLAL